MPDVIVVRLHPIEPADPTDFGSYLTDLTITAFDVSFAHPEFRPDPAEQIGVATHTGGADNRIVQHVRMEPNPTPPPLHLPVAKAAATAIIEVPGGGAEYATKDVLLRIERAGNEIVDRAVHYNVPIRSIADVEDHDDYKDLDASIFIGLPASGHELDPNAAFVDLPEDGSPPNFSDLKAAVITVLEGDPAPPLVDDAFLAGLTPSQSRHVGYEIVWNRDTHPLTATPASYEEMYTAPAANTDDNLKQARMQFEAELLAQYNTLNAQAEHLGRYVYSLAVAIACELRSDQAERVGLTFPVRPDTSESNTKIKEADVILFNP